MAFSASGDLYITGLAGAEAAVAISWMANLAYGISGLLFGLALHGLCRADSSRRGYRYAVLAMALSIGATLCAYSAAALPQICLALSIGGGVGFVVAQRMAMPALPQLVAGFQGLVGLTAMAVGIAGWLDPSAFGIPFRLSRSDCTGLAGSGVVPCALVVNIRPGGAVGLALGTALGALSFAGSVLACRSGGAHWRSGAWPSASLPVRPTRHRAMVLTVFALAVLSMTGLFAAGYQSAALLGGITALSILVGLLLFLWVPNMPVARAMLNSAAGWAAALLGFTLHNMAMVIAGGLVGSAGATLSVIWRRTATHAVVAGDDEADNVRR